MWGGVSPSPPGEGSGKGAIAIGAIAIAPLPRKILKFLSQNGELLCNMK